MAALTAEVAIVGGGIGGLALANSLRRASIPYLLLEATPQFKPLGFGIGFGQNAMDCLGSIDFDLQARIKSIGVPCTFTFCNGKTNKVMLSSETYPEKYKKYSPSGFLPMRRWRLHEELLRGLDPETILLDNKLTDFVEESDNIRVFTSKGTEVKCKLLVGADGIRSNVRHLLHSKYSDSIGPEPPVVFTNYTLFGGETSEIPEAHPDTANFTWHFSNRYLTSILPCAPGFAYFTLGARTESPNAVNGVLKSSDELKNKILNAVREHFHPEVQKKMEIAYNSNLDKSIVVWDIYRLARDYNRTKAWGEGRATLLGDAAHAMTPWIGQGAGISVEDSLDLTNRLKDSKTSDWSNQIREYERIRNGRAEYISRQALNNGNLFANWDTWWIPPFQQSVYKLMTTFPILANPLLDKLYQPWPGSRMEPIVNE